MVFLAQALESSAASFDMFSLRQLMARLDKGGAAERFPAEFGSFKASIAAAVALDAESGESRASQVIELAMMKGLVLEGKMADPALKEQIVLPGTGRFSEQQQKFPVTQSTSLPSDPQYQDNATQLEDIEPPQQLQAVDESWTVVVPSRIQTVIPGPDALRGGEKLYVVKKGDNLRVVAAGLGVSWRSLAKRNGLNLKKPLLKVGMKLRYNDRKIVPKNIVNGLLVNIPDRTLYLFKRGKIHRTAAVTVGRPVLEIQDEKKEASPAELRNWQTPVGTFTVTGKSKDPTWTVPPSIQKEMRQQGKEVLVKVPPGKNNPLGRYALKTSMKGIMLHSTNMPASIYGYNSHGCIRVSPGDMEEIFRDVAVNTRGEIIYMPVKVAVTEDGRVFIEVHRDVYAKTKDLHQEVQRLVNKYDIAHLVDWQRVDQLVKQQNGIAEDVTREM
jgi:lipoprotein-anchoring transpeptidase ErfK/SrfK